MSGRIEGQTSDDGIQSAIVLVVEDGGHFLLQGSSYCNVGIVFSIEWEVWSMMNYFRMRFEFKMEVFDSFTSCYVPSDAWMLRILLGQFC